VNYSHKFAQTKQQVGYGIVGAFLVHKRNTSKHIFTRFTITQTWGKAPPSPLIILFVLGHGACTQMSFCPETPKLGSLEIFKIRTLMTLEPHDLLYKPIIKVRFKAKL
jgi:hypothetical protein